MTRSRTAKLALVFLVLGGFALFQAGTAAAGPIGVVCTNGTLDTAPNPDVRSFSLRATSGHIQTPDGNSVFMWSYAPNGGSFQAPGPILCANQGEVVSVTLTNNLPEPVSIVFPGQTGVTAPTGSTGGSAGLLTKFAPSPGGTASYRFTADEPGTYVYESGTNPHKQIEMGLYGAVIVRPAMGANYAYNDASSKFDPTREYLLLLHDIDPALHAKVEQNQPSFDITTRHDRYFTVNGRMFPDTIADNGAPWLTTQPYGAMVQVEGLGATASQDPALIRYANAGSSNHPMHPHGNHLRVIARDGRLLKSGSLYTSFENFTRTIASGQTYDLLFKWTDRELWRPTTNPVPVTVPSNRNLVFKDGLTWYSGSPYIGSKETLPSGVTSNNQCGEYYFPWHSHALNEFVNFNEGFGGMATLLRVDAPKDFTITAAPSSREVVRATTGTNPTYPGTTTYTVTVARTSVCFTSNVALSVSGLPANTTGTLSPATITGGQGTSTLTIQTSSSTPVGTFNPTITGTSAPLVHSVAPPVSLRILAAAFPSAVTVTTGTAVSGSTAPQLRSSDNSRYQVTSGTSATQCGTTSSGPTADWYGTIPGVALSATPALRVTYEGSNQATGAGRTQRVFIWDTNGAGAWVQLNLRTNVNNDDQFIPGPTINEYIQPSLTPLSRFVNGSQQVRVRVCSLRNNNSFTSRGDLMQVIHG